MARYKQVNGVRAQLTPEEETARDAEEAYHASLLPMQNWKRSIQGTDSHMPRYAEDILDGMADKSGVAQITLDRLQEKKTLREAKP